MKIKNKLKTLSPIQLLFMSWGVNFIGHFIEGPEWLTYFILALSLSLFIAAVVVYLKD